MNQNDPLLWERWDEVDRLLTAALDMQPDERESFVARNTNNDPALAKIVMRLLIHSEAEDDSLGLPNESLVRDAFDSRPGWRDDLAPGTLVDRYRIVGRLGRGGMATVYSAERADGSYQQEVAIKILRRGLDTEDLVRRFLVERQILSRLIHPNIARLLDGGTTPDGRPYLVLDLVAGESIVDWADRHLLSVEARVRLFLDVADAVQDAHRQLVVHRDIKPSNILVDNDGNVKLLDFGIAKLLDNEDNQTDIGVRPLTPSYASPEQLAGGPISTATDVFQLGLLLRQLLTGVKPVAGDTNPGEISLRLSRAARIVNDGPSPGARAAARGSTEVKLQRQLRGDLEIIVGQALRAEPELRYSSAGELAADLRRYLRGLPISAHSESPMYLARKFFGRHRWVLPTTLAVVFGVSLFVATLIRYNKELVRERDAAESASRLASETQSFITGLFNSANPFAPADTSRGREITVVEALDLGVERLNKELAAQPALRTELKSTIGVMYLNLGSIPKAGMLIEQAVNERMATGDTVSAGFVEDLGNFAYLLEGADMHDSAVAVSRRRVDLARRLPDLKPERRSDALLDMAMVLRTTDHEAAIGYDREAVDVLDGAVSASMGAALAGLGSDLAATGRWDEAEAISRRALGILESEDGPETPRTALAMHRLGQILASRGKTVEAGRFLRLSTDLLERGLGPDHDLTLAMRANLGVFAIGNREFAEAEQVFRTLLLTVDPNVQAETSTTAGWYQNLAVAVAGQGRYREADSLALRAQQIFRELSPAGSPLHAYPRLTRAAILLDAGKWGEAAILSREAADILRDVSPVNSPGPIMADCRLGRAMAGMGKVSAARVLLDSAVNRLKSAEGVQPEYREECVVALRQLVEEPND